MPRSLVLGNDVLHVGFDLDYVLRDVYFPHVGQENHGAGNSHRTGVWFEGRFAWLDARDWEREVRYEEDTLVSDVRLRHRQWGLWLHFTDAVDLDRAVFIRRVTARNDSGAPGEVRLFFHYNLELYGIEVGDTVMYHPDFEAVVAYKGRRYFVANVSAGGVAGVHNWATGISGFRDREGTWRDAEDGVLQGNPVAQGSVDATVALDLGVIPAGSERSGYHWLAASDTMRGLRDLDQLVRDRGPASLIERTRGWWRAWRRKEPVELSDLGERAAKLYERSLLTMRAHADRGGAIVASTDWDAIHYSRDTYSYCWPRDGALISTAFVRAGYIEVSRRFVQFCMQVFNSFDGYFLHKFTPAGEVASTWHPWVNREGKSQLAIQEDETGLVLHALWSFYERTRLIEFVKPLYRPLVRGAADFMAGYRDGVTGLPSPSYDLWEERWGVHAFTSASVWAGLRAAARFAETFNESNRAALYEEAADGVRTAALEHLWSPGLGRFVRSVYPGQDGSLAVDEVVDASLLALPLLGMVEATDPRMVATVDAVEQALWCRTPVGGLARYTGDPYYASDSDRSLATGNPWFVTTMWLASYRARAARSLADLDRVVELLRWAEANALPSALLPEQLNPFTGEPLSVSPLAWSHSEYVTAVHEYLDARARLR